MSNEELVQLIQSGIDTKSNYEQLYTQNKGIIAKIAKRYAGHADIEDLTQEAYFGLVSAVENYKPEEGAFITYAGFWIRNSMSRYAYSNGAVTMSEGVRAKILKYRNIYGQYVKLRGMKPTRKLMSFYMGVSISQIIKLEEYSYRCDVSSLDIPCGEDSTETVGDLVPGSQGFEDEVVNDLFLQQAYDEMWKSVDSLEEEQAKIIRERYQGYKEKTYQEVGEKLGIAPARVRTVQNKALRKLRVKLRHSTAADYMNEYIYNQSLKPTGFHTTWTSSTERVALRLLGNHY
jgi:RNA polymerase primary sigma factor